MNKKYIKWLIIGLVHTYILPYAIDSSFGTQGIAIADFGMHSGIFNRLLGAHVKVQKDGKIVVVGDVYKDINNLHNPNSSIVVTRFDESGCLDTTFGNGGKVVLPIAKLNSFGLDLDIQKDDKIVIAARIWDKLRGDAALVRLNADGSFDTSFGNNGVVKEVNEGLHWSNFFRVKLRDNGRIIAVGNKGADLNDEQFDYNTLFIAQYMPNGQPDINFGENGKVTTIFKQRINSKPGDDAYSFDIQPDGKIVVVGRCEDASMADLQGIITSENAQSAIVRYHEDGKIDNSFGTDHNGIILHSLPYPYSYHYFNDVVVQCDSNIIAIGVAYNIHTHQEEFMIVRYTSDGLLDNSFGNNGAVLTTLGTHASPRNVLVHEDKILVTGVVHNDDQNVFTVVSYTHEGKVNEVFQLSLRGNDRSYALTAQKDKVVVIGDSFNGSYFDVALIRLN